MVLEMCLGLDTYPRCPELSGDLRERSQHRVRSAGRFPGGRPVPERADALQGRLHHQQDELERLGHGLAEIHRSGQHASRRHRKSQVGVQTPMF